ncbi:MAG: hypothetical protein EBX52_04150 [Proteobacteria bacterium]|nr:hypothetical protein [Pseudomonadota bacterium]
MFSILMFLLSSPSSAATLSDYLDRNPGVTPVIQKAYLEALLEFENDPVFCTSDALAPAARVQCRNFVRDQKGRLSSARFGQEWVKETRTRPSPFGPVLTFRNPSLLNREKGGNCAGVVAIPENPDFRKNLSFDLYCE